MLCTDGVMARMLRDLWMKGCLDLSNDIFNRRPRLLITRALQWLHPIPLLVVCTVFLPFRLY